MRRLKTDELKNLTIQPAAEVTYEGYANANNHILQTIEKRYEKLTSTNLDPFLYESRRENNPLW